MLARNATRQTVLADDLRVAHSWWSRFRGLMLRPALAAGEGLLLERCNAVHTHFMRFAIDVLFLDAAGKVVGAVPAMAPWRIGRPYRGARSVLELPAGTIRATQTATGDQVVLEDRHVRPV